MKGKRMLVLINDERTLRSVRMPSACDVTADDGGCYVKDEKACTNYAADARCIIDLAACDGREAIDYCHYQTDRMSCGPGALDA